MAYVFDATVPFESARHAQMVCDTLAVDPELRPNDVKRKLSVQDAALRIHFEAQEARMLRAAVGTFCDLLALAVRTLEAFQSSIVA